jgi:hypothetical protein
VGGGTNAPVPGRQYFVVATSLGAQTFRFATTPGGAAVDFSADITAGTVQKGARSSFVRAVKLTDLA